MNNPNVDKWGEPNSPRRELLAHAMAVEMKNKGFRPSQSQRLQMVEAPADTFQTLSEVVKTW